jgi:hypothetical protein
MAVLNVQRANADIQLNFFPVSDYNTNTATMDATLGITGYTIDSFESTTLIPNLSVTLSGGVTTTTYTGSLPNVFNENTCPGLTTNAAWDGVNTLTNTIGIIPSNCSTPTNIAQFINLNYAGGTASLGFGMGNFQSLNTPPSQFPITNHELFVNGIDEGSLESLAGSKWTPGLELNAYLRIDGTNGTLINSVEIENLTAPDVLMIDHLAVAPSTSPVPEPKSLVLLGSAVVALLALKLGRPA